MINEILERKEFQLDPPVLLDIGASGDLPLIWKDIAKHCICIAFDGDDRDFAYISEKSKNYKKLIIANNIVSIKEEIIDFYLTKSPYCSSTLKPDLKNLKNYAFANLFEIEKIIKLKAITLSSILSANSINKIDWYKSDTQGTDLRIIQSLNKEIINKVIIYELEPGIIDAYVDEDKLYSVLEYFNLNGFIVLDAVIKGSYRINAEMAKARLPDHALKNLNRILPPTPDWCEVVFFNSFKDDSLTRREYLLGWVFSIIKKQYGLALELAGKAHVLFNDPIFNTMFDYTINEINVVFKRTFKQKLKNRLVNLIERF